MIINDYYSLGVTLLELLLLPKICFTKELQKLIKEEFLNKNLPKDFNIEKFTI